MEGAGRTFADLVGLVKSWIPWRSEPAHVSRHFWIDDNICKVCYECESQFTLFNRKHHCRLCGCVFCAKCTSNWIPTPPSLEEWDKIRVCNLCFTEWLNGLTAPVDNGVQSANPDLCCTTPSAISFVSTKSSGTGDSSSVTFVSLQQSTGLSPYQSPRMELSIEGQNVDLATTNDNAMDIGGQNQSQMEFGFCSNRSDYDDDDDEYGIPHFDSVTSHFSKIDDYYTRVPFDDIDNDYQSHQDHSDGDAGDLKSLNSYSLQNTLDLQASEEVQQIVTKGDSHHDISDVCEATSSLYAAEDVAMEPVDFENNGVIWLPPEPEDEEDEREALLFADEDGDGAGEWGSLRNSSSFGSGEYRSRDKSNEEHKRVMKNVVDGHFRALVTQLLQVANLMDGDESNKESWLEIITALSWEAATLLKPDMSKGGQMDPGGYVKVKCLAAGLRSESMVVKGVVCKKNVAHRRMASNIDKPRLLILGGALEYQRVSNALSSFDTLLQQEMDHLKMAVAKIDAHHPDILLVEKSVSRYAQEYLLAKDISLVLNIKRPLLERIARCIGCQIVSSIDHISSQKLGYCDMFHVERLLEEHGTACQAGKKLAKTLMYFEGCPKPLGCTILLRGANGDELKKVKHVIQYGVFAAYHLALETSFLADEGASLPELPLNTPITVALPGKPSTIDRSISTIPGFTLPANEKSPGPQSVSEPQRSQSVPTSDLIKATIESIKRNEYIDTSKLPDPMRSQCIKPLSSSLNEPSPHCASEERGLVDLAASSEVKSFEAATLDVARDCPISNDFGDSNTKATQSDCCDEDVSKSDPILQLDGTLNQEPAQKEEFPPPSDHQSILVSLSARCVWKGTVCERAHLFRIKYYGNFDKPLGRYLREQLFDQNNICRSCEKPAEAHVQCYTHRQGSLTISVKKLSEILLPGERDGKIWMWHRCLKCPRTNGFPPATRRIVMSDAAWGLSFGKFLELSFSNHAAASRVASCGHSLHRDCLRFYGFGKMVACFRYASIDVHSVYLPPSQLNFNYESQKWIEKEFTEVTSEAELLFSEVLNALRTLVETKCGFGLLSSYLKIPESRRQLANLEVLLQNEKSEFEESLQRVLNKEVKKDQPAIDILELNRLRRQLAFMSYMWDNRLIKVSSLLDKKQPDSPEDTCSEPIQEPLDATEKLLDINVSLKTGRSLNALHSLGGADAKLDENRRLSDGPNNLQEVVPQRTDGICNSDHENQKSMPHSVGIKAPNESDSLKSYGNIRRALSDGQTPICLSDTLDAAWTGENHPVIERPQNNNNFESEADTTFTIGDLEKLEMEDHVQDLSAIKGQSDDMEDSWLGMSFASFYQSLNKNFPETAQKLEKIREYTPKYMSAFSQSELKGGARLLLPVGAGDTFIPVYDDEPTSIISHALASAYYRQLFDEQERPKEISESIVSMQSLDVSRYTSFHSLDEMMLETYRSHGSLDESMLSSTSSRSSLPLDPLAYSKALHARVSFEDDGPLGKVKYAVTCYYALRFEALRRICCPSEVDFVRSLSRCKKWGAQGGKSNVFFAKTLDDRFIIKQVTKTELESFIKFAPGYFKYISESIDSGSPTCLAKILGIYQVISKHQKGGKETKMDVLVMENLLFGRNVTRLYDLKGSSRSRYNPDSSGSNKVLLDQNLIEAMPTSPIFVGNKAKRLLERAVWNDTAFLASIDVMDYSLLVGVDEEKQELVLGIIDFMRQYTWDKHLETWVKASGILGGPKNASPTVISPKQYKRRFRKAMTTYFLMVPDQWSPATIIPSKSQTDLCDEDSQNAESIASAE